METDNKRKGAVALLGSCMLIFWPGAFIFGFPGVMARHWQESLGVGQAAVGSSLFFVLAGAGFFMYLTGRWQERLGTARVAAFGAILCGMSAILVGYARNIQTVYIWAFLVGISSALILIPCLTVVQQWYPRHRGLVSGLVNLVFGLSAAVMAPVFGRMLLHVGYPSTALITGILALVVGTAASAGVRLPDGNALVILKGAGIPVSSRSMSVSESLRTRAFWFMWATLALAGAGGISMVMLATPFGTAKGLSLQHAVYLLFAFNLTNGTGRLISGYLSDHFGRSRTMAASFVAAGMAYLLLPLVNGLFFWAVLASFIGFAFGALFAVTAPLAADCFGMRHFGAIFGLIFTAYGFVAGPLGPWLSGYLLDRTSGNFTLVFGYLGFCFLVAAVLIRFARPPEKAS